MRKIWLDGALIPESEAKVSVFDHGLLYGDGCFEGIRAYGGRVMKLGSHLARLYDSARRLRLEIPYSVSEVDAALRATLEANGLRDAYIRLVVTRGVGTLGLNPFKCPRPSVIIIAATIELYPEALYASGMPVITAKRRRVPIECVDPAIKSLNYLNNILAKIEAIDAGVLEAIMLNEAGEVAECTGDNLFLVTDGKIVTPHDAAGILHGVTRAFVLETLAPTLGIETIVRRVMPHELFDADEVFLTGTAAEIIGVNEIDGRPIGDGVGPITRRLMDEFKARIARGVPED